MKIAQVSIRRPVTVVMTFIGLAMIGIFAAFRLPIEQFPEVEVPYVGIGIPYPDSTAQEVERNLTRPVEEVLSTMSGIDRMFTFSRPGSVFVNLMLDRDGDVSGKGIEAKELIEGIRHRLPDDIRYINLRQEDPNSTPVMNVMIVSPELDEDQAFDLLDTHVRSEIERVPGVNSVNLYGIVRDYVRISLDAGRVAAYGLDYIDVQRRLQAENFYISGGTLRMGAREYQVRPIGRFVDLDAIAEVPLNAKGLKLRDVAKVEMVPNEENDRRRVNGERSLGVSVYKRPEANLVQVSRDIEVAMEDIRQDPVFVDTRFFSLDSQADTVLKSLNDLRDSGLLGGLLSVLVLFAFLRQFRVSLLIAITVPLALCATLGVMYFMGMTLNILSVVGLMLAIGLLVDNSVVVSEAIALRRREPGISPMAAADRGVSEVGLAITAGTLTTIVVFLPSFMTDNPQVAIVQQNIALPLCTALLGSLLVAQTLVPTVMARLPMPRQEKQHRMIDALAAGYEVMVRLTLRFRFFSFLVAVAIAGSGYFVYQQLEVNMNPEEESPRLQLNYFVRGSMDIEYIESFVERVDAYLLANREEFEIDNIFTSYDTDRGKTIINLVGDHRQAPKEIEEKITANIPELPNIVLRFSSQSRGFGGGGRGPGGGGSLGLRITGDSTDELLRIGDDIVSVLEQHPMLANVQHDGETGRDEIRIRVKPERASQMGVTASSIAQAVSIAIGSRNLRRGFVEGGRETDILLELQGKDDVNLDSLRRLSIFVRDQETVSLESVADITLDTSMRGIRRENRETSINVSFSTKRGPPAMAQYVVEDVMQKFELPPGYRWELGQEFKRDDEMFREMAFNVLLAIVLVYMVMAALFESVLFPSTVLIAIGYSVVGAFLSLWITGTTLTAMALTGMLLLAGIVVNNGIVLLNRIIQLRSEGVGRTDAIIASGRQRLRPILMTVCTTFVAMLPLAIGDTRVGGMGPSYFPMARALIGGLVFSTLVTLVILPLVYVLMDDLKAALTAFWRETLTRARRDSTA
ncbi:MAG: efflux RND transporter permease subunit [Pseudomonadales bacterium]|nr:efflux RND transporter permease subunit [Pseudomonadales bacterium]